jgi:hypothetical protein
MNLITATGTVIKAAAIVIFGCGVGWSVAEFDTQQLALEMAPTLSGNQMPPLSSCEADLAFIVRRRAASRGAATSPSADRASATLIGLDAAIPANIIRLASILPVFRPTMAKPP